MRGVTFLLMRNQKSILYFNSHASCEAWLTSRECARSESLFQLTRLMRGVTKSFKHKNTPLHISTHTPHARRDVFIDDIWILNQNFNSHASCEAWLPSPSMSGNGNDFNSHASCEAWHVADKVCRICKDFNSHASCEAWRIVCASNRSSIKFQLTRLMRGVTIGGSLVLVAYSISTHTPHARRDCRSMAIR